MPSIAATYKELGTGKLEHRINGDNYIMISFFGLASQRVNSLLSHTSTKFDRSFRERLLEMHQRSFRPKDRPRMHIIRTFAA